MYRTASSEKEYTDYDIWEGVVATEWEPVHLQRPSTDVLILNKGPDTLHVKYNSLNKGPRTFERGDHLELKGLRIHRVFVKSLGTSNTEIIALLE